MATRESFGRYFEEFEPGDVIEHWPGRTITERRGLVRAQQRSVRPEVVQLAQPGFIRDGTWGVSVRRIESEEPSTRRKSGHEPAPFGTTRHYVAQDQPLHVVVGGCALSSEGVCILGFRPDLHRVHGAVATWVKTGENPAAARRAGGKRGGMQGPCGCARGTPF